ncbi:MAG: HAD family hydrolase [Thermodesulfobacteriota bacterium]
MLKFEIPGGPNLELKNLILDYNGTIAIDGEIIPGVLDAISRLGNNLKIHILTADTHGTVREKFGSEQIRIQIISFKNQAERKLEYINSLGKNECSCIGNGRNDCLMLKEAGLGIAVIQNEGCSFIAAQNADILVSDILDAFNLLSNPQRLVATLRN